MSALFLLSLTLLFHLHNESRRITLKLLTMEQTNVEQALGLIFKKGDLLRDGSNYVGFLEHKYVFGYSSEDSLVVRSIDNHNDWLLGYVRDCFAETNSDERPDIREVWHEYYGRGVQITYGKLPWDWSPKPSH